MDFDFHWDPVPHRPWTQARYFRTSCFGPSSCPGPSASIAGFCAFLSQVKGLQPTLVCSFEFTWNYPRINLLPNSTSTWTTLSTLMEKQGMGPCLSRPSSHGAPIPWTHHHGSTVRSVTLASSLLRLLQAGSGSTWTWIPTRTSHSLLDGLQLGQTP